jgi:hypothetical protein
LLGLSLAAAVSVAAQAADEIKSTHTVEAKTQWTLGFLLACEKTGVASAG